MQTTECTRENSAFEYFKQQKQSVYMTTQERKKGNKQKKKRQTTAVIHQRAQSQCTMGKIQ